MKKEDYIDEEEMYPVYLNGKLFKILDSVFAIAMTANSCTEKEEVQFEKLYDFIMKQFNYAQAKDTANKINSASNGPR